MSDSLRTAVVGAGIAGLAAARTLADRGADVTVFDKGRGPAGRTSTRRGAAANFDHGAQYFTARDPRFRARIDRWRELGLVARWDGRIASLRAGGAAPEAGAHERLVGVPGMNAMAKHLAADLKLHSGVRVAPLAPVEGDGRALRSVEGAELGVFDRVLVTLPAPQAAELLPRGGALAAAAGAIEMDPCTALMLALAEPWDLPFDGAFVDGGTLSWVARNSSKPGRPSAEAWVLHAAPGWSLEHWDDEPRAQVDALVAELERLTGTAAPRRVSADLHRWRYAIAREPLDAGFLTEDDLVLAGDWCRGNRVEGAWLSGVAAAEFVLTGATDRLDGGNG